MEMVKELRGCHTSYPPELVRWCLERAPAPGLIVDLGCGTGISTRLFATTGHPVIGIDPNADLLATARAEGAIVQVDAPNAPYRYNNHPKLATYSPRCTTPIPRGIISFFARPTPPERAMTSAKKSRCTIRVPVWAWPNACHRMPMLNARPANWAKKECKASARSEKAAAPV